MRRAPLNQPNFTIRRERDARALSRLTLLLCCGMILAGGFVFAAGQHFTAISYGYESEKLRQEHARLMEEQRRLLLERERAVSPARLESAAREIGLLPVRPAQIEAAKSVNRIRPHTASAFVNSSASLGR